MKFPKELQLLPVFTTEVAYLVMEYHEHLCHGKVLDRNQSLHTSTSKAKISIRQELLRIVACRAARLRLT